MRGDGRRLRGDKDGLIKIVTWKSEIDEKKLQRTREVKKKKARGESSFISDDVSKIIKKKKRKTVCEGR